MDSVYSGLVYKGESEAGRKKATLGPPFEVVIFMR
jgi:hypothetical protein